MVNIFLQFLVLSLTCAAQSVDVKSIDGSSPEGTTIEIKKGIKPDQGIKSVEPKWTIEPGSAEIEGEPSATTKDARAAWKKACEDWKKEFREDNKQNKILSISCGSPVCGGDAGSKVCSSKASYKIKTRVD